jgi:hypothetical protein
LVDGGGCIKGYFYRERANDNKSEEVKQEQYKM